MSATNMAATNDTNLDFKVTMEFADPQNVEGELTVDSKQKTNPGELEFNTLDEPIRDTIFRDVRAVGKKFYYVLYPKEKKSLLKEWDLWGPLVLCTFMAMLLHGSYDKANNFNDGGPEFAEIFVLVWLGSTVITVNSKLLGGNIGSTDHTVRLWTLGGCYISTFGTFRPWSPILPAIPAYQYLEHHRRPPDVKRFASSTTLRVLDGGIRRVEPEAERDVPDTLKITTKLEHTMVDGKRLTISIMDKSVLMIFPDYPVLDASLPYIPIYTHLKLSPLEIIQTPKFPAFLYDQKGLIKRTLDHTKESKWHTVRRFVLK